ncbi:MAG TPA: nucleoside transporter C-terminal domain-containing protein, partial [Gemmatimonadales bacterium]|nr:nucleoside transporter C-terminal domain-containing protein [Gemmatimonadales bacterium]
IAAIMATGYALSRDRRRIPWKTVAWGGALQVVFAITVLKLPLGQRTIAAIGEFVRTVLGYAQAGSSFVFGEVGRTGSSLGMVFAFQVLPAIIFVSALFAILYYVGVMPLVVRGMAALMSYTMKASGAESTATAANVFMGQTEAPLTIRPFLPNMTRSELMTVMTSGMASVSGSIMAAYIAFGIEPRHILTAVVMTAPGSIMLAKLMEPEDGQPETAGTTELHIEKVDVNVVDAAARGTSEGLQLMLNVIAMLVSFIALVALVNGLFGWLHGLASWFPSSLQVLLGWICRPLAWALGVNWTDASTVGSLIGTRAVLNEFIAFADLGNLAGQLDPRSVAIASFALTGFANVSSVGIQIGGIGALAPGRKHDLARLGFRAMLAATMANLLSAAIAGMML